MMKRKITISITIAFLTLGGTISAKVIDGVFININGNAVTYSEFREFVAHMLKISESDAEDYLSKERSREKLKSMTNDFIDTRLIHFELEKLGDRVTEEELDAVIQRIVGGSGLTQEEFGKALEGEGMTMGAYRENLRLEMEKSRVIRALKGKEVMVTDEEAKNFYLENRDRFKRNYMLKITMLSFPLLLSQGREELIRVREIVSGADSIVENGGGLDAVKNFLENRGLSVEETELGPVSIDDLNRELKTEVAGLSRGETSRSTIMEDRVAYLQVTERTGGEYLPFEDVKDLIREELVGKRSIGAIKEIIRELRSSSYIEVYL